MRCVVSPSPFTLDYWNSWRLPKLQKLQLRKPQTLLLWFEEFQPLKPTIAYRCNGTIISTYLYTGACGSPQVMKFKYVKTLSQDHWYFQYRDIRFVTSNFHELQLHELPYFFILLYGFVSPVWADDNEWIAWENIAQQVLSRALDPLANGTLLCKLTEWNLKSLY